MTVKVRHFYRKDGTGRNVSEYVIDPRDLRDGKPPAYFLLHTPMEKADDEIEFDHIPSEEELKKAFNG